MEREKLDTSVGSIWLQEFAAETGADVSRWSVVAFGSNLRIEHIPDDQTARKLAQFLPTRHPVSTHVYTPIKNGWEVVVLKK